MLVPAGNPQGVEPFVKRHENTTPAHGQSQQIVIREMHGGGQVGKLPRIAQREVIRPELMAGEHQQALQRPSRFLRTARSARIALSSEDAQKAILRQRAGRPALPKGGGFQMAEGRFGMEDG